MTSADNHAVVSRQDWLDARRELLKQEKALTQMRELIAARRRELPWVKIESDYSFDTPDGPMTLDALFGDASQLIVHHLMFHPDGNAACPGCTFQAEHITGPEAHLRHKGVAIVAVSRAPLEKIQAYQQRLGLGFRWVSSRDSAFNYDFSVSFPPEQVETGAVDYNFGTIREDPRYVDEELPGISVFYRDESGAIFHTYSTFARGLDELIGTNHYLDITPRGRNESAYPDWPRRRDEYETAQV